MGGKALKNVVRICKEEMLPTLQVLQEHLYQVLGLTFQVDLMPVENVGMAHWGMFTDGDTQWKSATRNGLLRAIAKFRDTVVHTNDEGTIISFDRFYFDQRH